MFISDILITLLIIIVYRYVLASAFPAAACTIVAQRSSTAFVVAVRRHQEDTLWQAQDDKRLIDQ